MLEREVLLASHPDPMQNDTHPQTKIYMRHCCFWRLVSVFLKYSSESGARNEKPI